MTSDFIKILRIGTLASVHAASLFCRVEYKDRRLSITGVEGPLPNGNARGSRGQCIGSVLDIRTYAPDWTPCRARRFHQIWRDWHLNDMRAGCEHQRADGWHKRSIDTTKPLNTYGIHFAGQRQPSWNMLGWITREEHPEGLLSHPCPVCGYRYGSAWQREAVPKDVLAFLRALPDADRTPHWV